MDNRTLIMVGGMCKPDNIREVAQLDIDWLGLNFTQGDARVVWQISSEAGTMPDYPSLYKSLQMPRRGAPLTRVGVFADDMPQSIVTRVYNFDLDIVLLCGEEWPVMVQNLRRTLDPDIHPGVRIVKAFPVASRADLDRCRAYDGVVDCFLFLVPGGAAFDWAALAAYEGHTPFLIGGDIGMEEVPHLLALHHPQFVGVEVSDRFETAVGVKDADRLRSFVQRMRRQA